MKKIERFMEVEIHIVLSTLFFACGVHNLMFGHLSTVIWSFVLATVFMYEFITERKKFKN